MSAKCRYLTGLGRTSSPCMLRVSRRMAPRVCGQVKSSQASRTAAPLVSASSVAWLDREGLVTERDLAVLRAAGYRV